LIALRLVLFPQSTLRAAQNRLNCPHAGATIIIFITPSILSTRFSGKKEKELKIKTEMAAIKKETRNEQSDPARYIDKQFAFVGTVLELRK
jgi:hypothetical protein